MTSLVGYKPIQLNLPEKFAQFRPAQIEAADHVLGSPYRFNPMSLPIGSGKSLIAMAIAKASGLRTVILTATKGLMRQYTEDFYPNLAEIKGRANYTCAHWMHLNCRYGALEGCPLVDGGGCNYECQRDMARLAPIVVSNYAYWFHVNEHPHGLNDPPQFDEDLGRPIQQLILDEVHSAPGELSKYLQTQVKQSWLHIAGLKQPESENIGPWREFALNSIVIVTKLLAKSTKSLKLAVANHSLTLRRLRDEVYMLDALKTSLAAISVMNPEDWVMEEPIDSPRHDRVWVFDNVWPAQHSFKLFRNIPKIILMSGTLRPITLRLLGIPENRYKFREWPRIFPSTHTPVYYIPTVRMSYGVKDWELDIWVRRIDEIIESRLDRKGIIHTVSYPRQAYLVAHSKFGQYMLGNTGEPESDTAAQVVDRFKALDAPSILVSPSFSTGWDFPGRDCEWQIIAKVPFPDPRSKVIQARSARMSSYIDQIAMQDIEQASGRGTRSHLDRCEIFIIDDAIKGLMFRCRNSKSRWFDYIQMNQVPPPGPRCPE